MPAAGGPLTSDLFQPGIAGFVEQTRASGGVGLVFPEFDGVPVDLVGALGQGRVGNQRAVTDQDDGRDGTGLDGLVASS